MTGEPPGSLLLLFHFQNFKSMETYFVIVNRLGDRMYQYGMSTCYEWMLRILLHARQQYPDAGMHIESRQEE